MQFGNRSKGWPTAQKGEEMMKKEKSQGWVVDTSSLMCYGFEVVK